MWSSGQSPSAPPPQNLYQQGYGAAPNRPSQPGGYPRQQAPQGYGQAPSPSGYGGQQQQHYQQQHQPSPGYGGAPQHQGAYGQSHTPPQQGQQQQGQQDLWGWFQAVDRDRSGRICLQQRNTVRVTSYLTDDVAKYSTLFDNEIVYLSSERKRCSGKLCASELQQALSNGFSQFNIETVSLLLNMFDTKNEGKIDFPQFQQMFGFINQWTAIFNQYDMDRSRTINFTELKTALSNFGYRLSDRWYNLIMARFCSQPSQEITFDNFIRICVLLNNITQHFRTLDTQQRGQVTVSYEQFTEIFFHIV